ncbi:MAG: hypothetical protein AEth_00534 [Candidatus Argoarchaeum ethanivorans]|uniref:Dockerin domain-containing protein n=1 Tax=Candidatus Argoarchaeum ethanivorans TaxID=2608793 RepID=A0A8B3S415_9EURY|nr:MAG: hypothetical protein AEth_00534 [Candidatus Argoarchaeum ethanivorans]
MCTPPTVWLRLTNNGTVLDDQVHYEGGSYTYSRVNGTILSLHMKTVFEGGNTGQVNLTNAYQYDESTGTTSINNESHAMIFGEIIEGETWHLYENYAITPIDIDACHSPRRAWLRFTKNNITVDEKVVKQGDNYTYYKNGQLIFTAYIDSVFAGAISNMVQLRYVRQYSEIDGTPLIEFGDEPGDKKTLVTGKFIVRSKDNKGVLLHNSHGNKISNNLIKSYFYGIHAISSSKNTLTNNTASNNCNGIYLQSSSNNTASNNTASNNTASNNTASNNTASNNTASNNTASNNTASNNCNGIYLQSSSNNTLTNNTASNNWYGICLYSSSDKLLYHNNLINNTNNNAYGTGTNQWNTSTVGNYYSDYTGSDNNSDGIGVTSYQILGGSNIDYFPLMHPWKEIPPLKGDLDDDYQITSTDAAIVLEITVGSRSCNPKTLAIADVSGDGNVSSLDALMILQMAA